MTEDFIDKTFASLDDFYPNSKRKRMEPIKVETRASAAWDTRPHKKTLPNGKDVDMFTLGALASALGRPLPTLRLWMKEGNLPASPYRLPTTKDRNGVERAGRRLYTRGMIEAAVEIFGRAGLLTKNRVDWSTHRHLTSEIDEAWDKIRAKETE